MTSGDAARRLAIAERRLAAAEAEGKRREAASLRIAVDVLRSLADSRP